MSIVDTDSPATDEHLLAAVAGMNAWAATYLKDITPDAVTTIEYEVGDFILGPDHRVYCKIDEGVVALTSGEETIVELKAGDMLRSLPETSKFRLIASGELPVKTSWFEEMTLIERDVLKVDWDEICPGDGWKVVANLPYNIGTTVLMRLLRRPHQFASVTVMLQLEVVQRLFAEPGSKAYNALSLEAQVRGKPHWVSKLGPDAFFPPPKVSSAVVRFELFDAPRVGDVPPAYFDRVVRAAFSQRRKNIVNSLGSGFGKERVRQVVAALGVNPASRAEQLDADTFRAFASALHREEQAVTETRDTSES